MSAPTIRIASSPSRSMMMNDCTKRLNGEPWSPSVRSALSSPASSWRRSASSSAGVAPPAARVRSEANAVSSSAASAGFLARTPRSTCSNVMYASKARPLAAGSPARASANAESSWPRTWSKIRAVAAPV